MFSIETKIELKKGNPATTPRERNIADFLVSDMIGVAATRVEDRVFAALGLQNAEISFESCESVEYGGVSLKS